MAIKDVLKEFDIEGKKADVYLAVLELGGAGVSDIARKSGTKRTTVYDILVDLQKSGLLHKTIKGKKRLFVAEDPEKLQIQLEKKRALLEGVLPELRSLHNVKGGKPKIRFYEGKEGILEIYNDTLKHSGEILGFGSEDVLKIFGEKEASNYIKQRLQKRIYYRGIFQKTALLEKDYLSQDQEQMRSSKLIDPKKYPFSIEINIYGYRKVAFISPKDTIGVIIESAEIYRAQKSIFELLWDLLPEIEKK
ncbi:MAG: helix-turn-helix domain-containing protein [Patescibacteria group bacterium]|nr:helix-turn-helix domain-containing protein [Patescibacteria group bacterium]